MVDYKYEIIPFALRKTCRQMAVHNARIVLNVRNSFIASHSFFPLNSTLRFLLMEAFVSKKRHITSQDQLKERALASEKKRLPVSLLSLTSYVTLVSFPTSLSLNFQDYS